MRTLLEYVDLESLVRDNLVESLDLELEQNKDEGGHPLEIDVELVKALVLVIEYYTARNEFHNIVKKRKEQLKEFGIEVN